MNRRQAHFTVSYEQLLAKITPCLTLGANHFGFGIWDLGFRDEPLGG